MVRLYIENKEVELTDDVQFAITSQFEDLSNPTAIINDWSKTVSIPFTQKNNELFGHIYNPDKVIVEGGSSVGIYFNPLKKLDFRLEWNSAVLMQGYAKMNQVKMNGDKGTYEITLFGELGKVFSEMKKITFDLTSDNQDYIIDGSVYVDASINKEVVYDSWTSSGQTTEVLKKRNDSGYHLTDIIGFAPNNSFPEGFECGTLQSSSNSSMSFEDMLGTGFTADTGIEPSTVIPNGLLPREYGEYRSYLQLPFIYWNKLFKIFQEKAESLTGYSFDYDKYWFNKNNPYWYNLVYMLKPFNFSNKENTSSTNLYVADKDTYTWVPVVQFTPPHTVRYLRTGTTTYEVDSFTTVNETVPLYVSGNTFHIDNNTILSVDGNLTLRVSFTTDSSVSEQSLKFSQNQALIAHLIFTGNNNTVIDKKIVFAVKDTTSEDVMNQINTAFAVGLIEDNTAKTYIDTSTNQRVYYVDFVAPLNKIGIDSTLLDNTFDISYTINWYNVYQAPITNSSGYASSYPTITDNVLTLSVNTSKDTFHSGSEFTLNSLWNKEFNLFDEILKYCKMYRIMISSDTANKKILFRRVPEYFSDYKVLDWTNKVDKSKDFIIKPVTFENKYVMFNYKDIDTAIAKNYKEKYGVNFGEYRLTTDYNFNNEKTELFKDIKPPIVSTDNVLSILTLARHKIAYTFGAEIFVNNKDKDKKQVDLFGTMFFHNGIVRFDTSNDGELAWPNISDDSAFQKGNETYFYTAVQPDKVYVDTYPKLDIVHDDSMIVYNTPKENYTYVRNYEGKKPLYVNFWERYINERYNIQNKLITCYIDLSPIDYCQFDFNNFVKIGNQLCIVNKIYDYDVTSNQTTKVDLLTVQDIQGYTKDDYIEDVDIIKLSWDSAYYFNGDTGNSWIELGTFDSISDVTFSNGLGWININGVQFTITGNTVKAKRMSEYVDEPDIHFDVVLKNAHTTTSFHCVRYSVYPYPYISITDGDGNVVTTLERNTTYKLNWECTETEGLENKPTVTLTRIAGLIPTLGSDWTVEEKMYQDGDDEYFRNKYSVSLTTRLAVGTFYVNIVDVEGWNQTRNY